LKKSFGFDAKAAKKQLKEMQTMILPSGIKGFMWYFNKSFRHLIRGIFLD
jgi:hypothetical protein